MSTLERIEDGEKVERGDLEDTVGKESKAPCNAQHETQAHDAYDIYATLVPFCFSSFDIPETAEPGHHDDEGGKSEEED